MQKEQSNMFKIFFFILFSLSANSLEISSISSTEKKELKNIDPRNFYKKARKNRYFIGVTGKHSYREMEKYGKFVEENFSKSKIYFRKYKDYLEFKKLKDFLFPRFYIETDRKDYKIKIQNSDFLQGMRVERDKKYKIQIVSGEEKIEQEILFSGQKVVMNFGNRIDVSNKKNKNRQFMWKKGRRFVGNWKESNRHCEKLREDGFSDWRLPTLIELWHVKNRETDKNDPRIGKKEFWSSDKAGSDKVWGVDLKTGSDKIFSVSSEKKATCVRGDSELKKPKYKIVGGIFIDDENKLMWNVENKKESWKKTRITCLNSEHGGFEDWRMPTIRELYKIRDSEIDGRFWSNTSFFKNYRKAWGLNNDTKKDTWENKENLRNVICVRKF
jgi:hypothetical protein